MAPPGISSEDVLTAGGMLTAWLAYYLLARTALGARFKTPSPTGDGTVDKKDFLRARSWLLSLLMSAILTAAGLYYGSMVASTYWFKGWQAVHTYLLTADPQARILNLAFLSFLFADICIGLVDYRHNIGLLTGWIHHTVYASVIVWFLWEGVDTFFPAFSPCELPTLLLAVGSVNKHWRVDLPMGVAFFVTRIAYYGGLIAVIARAEGAAAVRPWLGCAIFALHVYWFRGWWKSFARLQAGQQQQQPKQQQQDGSVPSRGGASAVGGSCGSDEEGEGSLAAPPMV